MKTSANTKAYIFNDNGEYIGWNTMANLVGMWCAQGKSSEDIKELVETVEARGWLGHHQTNTGSMVIVKALDWDIRGKVREGLLSFEAVALMIKV